ncbi:vitamin B12 dependent-methionine synthase activation domain-containing protein [Roseburia sp. 499]|uniref:vitamin B12 dependent-methionine synthase activation domain-containing protein n=1 Tax=Roseburia sp. 499 TaxID=1261634 RepID=UPI0009518B2C|nr:vitamin B12 dependent-methionine synthase activation domain-containing protein [Roseburia sp. 499]WVK68485.1 vitamin B12 dependent-methionine synthase activation domain-containing protein [Roseburia sp. 499]
MKVDRKETLRYLGYRGSQLDEQTEKMIEEVTAELERDSLPKSVYREYDCKVVENQVRIGQYTVVSNHLAKNLQGCERAVILAATIGRAADLMIKKYSVVNMAKATVVQAAGASAIENYVDEVEDEIRKSAESRGLYLRPRFSPGYGDFPLECQKDIFQMLECSKRIGITLTEGNLMMPTKSVTAVIGLTTEKYQSCHQKNCSRCEKTDCEFREE